MASTVHQHEATVQALIEQQDNLDTQLYLAQDNALTLLCGSLMSDKVYDEEKVMEVMGLEENIESLVEQVKKVNTEVEDMLKKWRAEVQKSNDKPSLKRSMSRSMRTISRYVLWFVC